MSSYTRGPLPQTHRRHWAAMDEAESTMYIEEDLCEEAPSK
jgi:hypothetical protein